MIQFIELFPIEILIDQHSQLAVQRNKPMPFALVLAHKGGVAHCVPEYDNGQFALRFAHGYCFSRLKTRRRRSSAMNDDILDVWGIAVWSLTYGM